MSYFYGQGKTNPPNLSPMRGGSGISTGILSGLGKAGVAAPQAGTAKTFGTTTDRQMSRPIPEDCPDGQIWDDALGKCVMKDSGDGGGGGGEDPQRIQKCINACVRAGGGPQKIADCMKGCKATPPPGECGKGIVKTGKYPEGKTIAGCPCSAAYYPSVPGVCQAGYHAVGEGADARCECDLNVGDEGGGGGQGQLGEYTLPANIQQLMDMLLNRGKEYMTKAPGYDESTLAAMLGSNLDNIRGAGNATRQTTQAALQRSGLAGTGAGLGMLGRVAANTEANVGNTMRDLYVGNEVQKKKDLADYTDMASKLATGQLTAQQLIEMINSGRRGEGQAALQAFLQWLAGQM